MSVLHYLLSHNKRTQPPPPPPRPPAMFGSYIEENKTKEIISH